MREDGGIGPLDALLRALAPDDGAPAPREVAELIWLARNLPEGAMCPGPHEDEPPVLTQRPAADTDIVDADSATEDNDPVHAGGEETPLYLPDHGGPTQTDKRLHPASAVRVAGATALPRRRALARALRPLKRGVADPARTIVDEDATANLIADTGRWLPVLVPARIRWLSARLVIDAHGEGAALWEPIGRGLCAVLQESGAFRDVRTHWLSRDGLGRPVLIGSGRQRSRHSAVPLLGPADRTVTLLLTDGVDPAWHEPGLQHVLRRWAATGPTAILQTLPERLWGQTALAPESGRFDIVEAGASNLSLRFTPYTLLAQPSQPGEVPVPVLGIEPEWLAPWAQAVAGTGSFDGAAVRLPVPDRLRAADGEPNPRTAPGIGFEEFLAQASPRAFRLAACLAVTDPLNLALMRLVQSTMLPDSPPSELAEIVFSGLLRRRPGGDADTDALQQTYEFTPDVRQRLRSTLRRDETRAVVAAVSAYVDRTATAVSARFTAAVADPDGPLSISAGAQHWAVVKRVVNAPAQTAPTGTREDGRRFLIAIGAAEREGTELPPLPSVVGDIIRVSAAFENVGYRLVLPHLARSSSAYSVFHDIHAWHREAELGPRDVVVVYVAGHTTVRDDDISFFVDNLRLHDLHRVFQEELGALVYLLDTDYGPNFPPQAFSNSMGMTHVACMAYGMRRDGKKGSVFSRALCDELTVLQRGDGAYSEFSELYSRVTQRTRRYAASPEEAQVVWYVADGRSFRATPPVVLWANQSTAFDKLFDGVRDLPGSGNVQVVTGPPGSGKSTLFALLADRAAQELSGRVVALTAAGKGVNDLWEELAVRLTMSGLAAGRVMDFMATSTAPWVVVIDGLDEAAPGSADWIVSDMVRPLARTPSVHVVVGARDTPPALLDRDVRVIDLRPPTPSNRIVGVHGIGQQFLGSEALLYSWQPALLDGMARAGRTAPTPDVTMSMAYYGDLFRTPDKAQTPELSDSSTDSGVANELLVTWAEAALGRVPVGTNLLRTLARSRFFGEVTTRAVTTDLRQIHAYLTDPGLRAAAQERVLREIGEDTRVVVAHSLGSVIAYEALCALPHHRVRALVTLGSPLGTAPVFRRLQPAPREVDGVLRGQWPGGRDLVWTNIADKDDIVAAVKNFDTQFVGNLRSLRVDNGSRAHDVTRYLSTPACGAAVAEGLLA
ncbi:SAV_2336 N-terminal domain-related protein [Streptomyces lincolnensis]|uniref:SAV_2336 N-terminal domain-related protein n=1 Tax=Streptomyces lincolnensis TaxID=1915 RepID=UPI0037D5C24E